MDAAEILDALAGRFLSKEKIVEVLASSGGEPSPLLGLFRGEGVMLEDVGDLLKAIHLLYLRSQDTWFLHLSMLLYAAPGSREAVQLFLSGRVEEALALAAYTARLRVEKPSVEPWRDPGAWVRALQASYYLDVGVKVIREILSRYGFREHFGERACSHSCGNTAE
ncbi:MAG: hypothetical protein QXT28_12470 [Thermofilaceae archaeon]